MYVYFLLVVMPVLKRPAMARRPAAAESFDIAAWERGLDIGPEADRVGIVYLGTFSRCANAS